MSLPREIDGTITKQSCRTSISISYRHQEREHLCLQYLNKKTSTQMPFQIIYSSQATELMTVTELEEILSDARVGNKARNITGALIYVDGVFFRFSRVTKLWYAN